MHLKEYVLDETFEITSLLSDEIWSSSNGLRFYSSGGDEVLGQNFWVYLLLRHDCSSQLNSTLTDLLWTKSRLSIFQFIRK